MFTKRITYGNLVQITCKGFRFNIKKNLENIFVKNKKGEKKVRKCQKCKKLQNSIALSTEVYLNFTYMHFYYAFKIPSGTVKYDWLSLHSILLWELTRFQGLAGHLAGDSCMFRMPCAAGTSFLQTTPMEGAHCPPSNSGTYSALSDDHLILFFFFFCTKSSSSLSATFFQFQGFLFT